MATPRRLLHRALDGFGDGRVTLAEGASATVRGDGLPCVRIDHRSAISDWQMLFAAPRYASPGRLPAQGPAP